MAPRKSKAPQGVTPVSSQPPSSSLWSRGVENQTSFGEYNATIPVTSVVTPTVTMCDEVMKVGKYQGIRFDLIARTDANYCGWVLSQNKPGGSLLNFRDFLVRKLAG